MSTSDVKKETTEALLSRRSSLCCEEKRLSQSIIAFSFQRKSLILLIFRSFLVSSASASQVME
jgi:hypothetical protein